MEKINTYEIAFSGLKLGKHDYKFNIKQSFFDLFKFEQEFSSPDLDLNFTLEKKSSMLILDFSIKGNVELLCDLINKPYFFKIEEDLRVLVNFGDVFDNSDDELLTIPRSHAEINIAQYVYEMTLLAIPLKKEHPDVQLGNLDDSSKKIIDYLGQNIEKKTDPRWDKLKEIK